MAERDVEVVAVGPTLRLRLLGNQCEGCQGGCAGRCNLFATTAAGEFAMDAPSDIEVRAGQRFRLALDDEGLRRAAWKGYGRALAGLLLGSGAGHVLGLAWPSASDALTLAGLLSGTFLAVASSKRHVPAPRLLPAAAAPQPPLQE